MVLRNRLKEYRAILSCNQQERGKRVVYQDKQSVTLALTIAKVCGVKVEDVFYLEEEENKEK